MNSSDRLPDPFSAEEVADHLSSGGDKEPRAFSRTVEEQMEAEGIDTTKRNKQQARRDFATGDPFDRFLFGGR